MDRLALRRPSLPLTHPGPSNPQPHPPRSPEARRSRGPARYTGHLPCVTSRVDPRGCGGTPCSRCARPTGRLRCLRSAVQIRFLRLPNRALGNPGFRSAIAGNVWTATGPVSSRKRSRDITTPLGPASRRGRRLLRRT
ncbi:hypothetical protein CERSUDRAFT_120145 [Gelatoporia subvermispora B]|uniref:Uncharacterized protein n=1 Tax=Ceriporiopsis subvermispora (strain B) TaxID=914234 RepID=M2QYV1_CERS8|nr:hypothetical protein CERSUDRAFT_120145 [Gelatoporia subvermispora B]